MNIKGMFPLSVKQYNFEIMKNCLYIAVLCGLMIVSISIYIKRLKYNQLFLTGTG